MAATLLLETYAPTTARYGADGNGGELAGLAIGLYYLMESLDAFPAALPHVIGGFRELAGIAHSQGQARVRSIALALASILENGGRAPEGDLPFILDTAAAYLESLPGKLQLARGHRCNEGKAS